VRASTIRPMIELLSYYPEGLTRKEMIGKKRIPNVLKKTVEEYNFSRISIERHIKKLMALRVVERTEESNSAGKRGRPTGRYKIRDETRNNLELFAYTVPNLWQENGKWYTGIKVRNPKTKGSKHLRKKEWVGLPFKHTQLDMYSKRAPTNQNTDP
jgi:hypothetical protein